MRSNKRLALYIVLFICLVCMSGNVDAWRRRRRRRQPAPVHCAVSGWSSWSSCSATCGQGVKSRTRSITRHPAHGGHACPTLYETTSCKDRECAVHCSVSGWGSWSHCSATCGAGAQERERTVTVQPSHGGHNCPHLSETQDCYLANCILHCEVSDWSSWGLCSTSCGDGVQHRQRQIIQESQHGGASCPSLSDIRECQDIDPCPEDCVVSDWSNWGECSQSCGGGIKTRHRQVEKESNHGGALCPVLEETTECDNVNCPINCQVSNWSAWGVCSTTCGHGTSQRHRTVTVQPEHGGQNCPHLTESQSCLLTYCVVDCEVSRWSSWGVCSTSCGDGVQHRQRQIIQESQHGGASCPSLSDTRECQDIDPCPEDCVVSDWSNWGECSQSCGGGIKTRHRQVEKESNHGGALCPVLEETTECDNVNCPINCQVSNWSAWGVCSTTCGHGTSQRHRTVTVQSEHGGQNCPHLTESQSCLLSNCVVDCEVSHWSLWGVCSVSCGDGVQHRQRQIIQESQHGGASCPSLSDTRKCQDIDPCPEDCVVSNWSNWGECSQSCGNGVQRRQRQIIQESQHGGASCPSLTDTRECLDISPCPVDCEVEAWSHWSECSKTCGSGEKSRHRIVKVEASIGGIECPALTEVHPCSTNPCPVECLVSSWSSYGECSVSCGSGMHSRSRIITNLNNVTEPCPHLSESATCEMPGCEVDCELSDWSEYTDCSVSCGGGTEQRTREVLIEPEFGGKECGSLSHSRPCNQQPCPVDCQMTSWNTIGPCTRNCGGGLQNRVRKIQTYPAHGGEPCSTELRDQVPCNTQDCDTDIQR